MRLLREWRMPAWLRAAHALRLGPLLRRARYDTRHLPAAERVGDDDGLRMLALAVRDGRYDFELAEIPPARGVLVQDLAFNAILAAANRSLVVLAGDAGVPLADDLLDAVGRHARAVEGLLWDPDAGEYRSRDARTGELLPERTVAGFLPLFGGTPSPERAGLLAARLREPGWSAPYPVPTVPTDAPEFRERRYWQGPTWVNTNWMLVEGLGAYGYGEQAAALRSGTLEMVAASGFAEYFSPFSGAPLGAPAFSWTAALTIDLARGAAGR
jgi:alpha,alpha-trehalase